MTGSKASGGLARATAGAEREGQGCTKELIFTRCWAGNWEKTALSWSVLLPQLEAPTSTSLGEELSPATVREERTFFLRPGQVLSLQPRDCLWTR